MDLKRNLLLVALAVVSYLMLLAWNKDYPVDTGVVSTPSAVVQPGDNLPSTPTTSTANDLPLVQGQQTPVTAPAQTTSNLISISTPFQLVTRDLLGGDIVKLALPKFPTSIKEKNDPFVLLNNENLVYVAQSGLIGPNGPDANTAGLPLYRSAQTQYSIVEGELVVDLTTTAANNVEIIKRFIFSADDYLIRINYLISNKSVAPWKTNLFGQIKRDRSPDPSSTSQMVGGNTY